MMVINQQLVEEIYTKLWKLRLHIKIGFQECANMDFQKELTFAHF